MKNLIQSQATRTLLFSRNSLNRRFCAATLLLAAATIVPATAANYYWKGGDGTWDLGVYDGTLVPGTGGSTNPSQGAFYDTGGTWTSGTDNWRNSDATNNYYWVNGQNVSITATAGPTGPWMVQPDAGDTEIRGRAIFREPGGGTVTVIDNLPVRSAGLFTGMLDFEADGYILVPGPSGTARIEANYGSGASVETAGHTATLGEGIQLVMSGSDGNLYGAGTLNVLGNVTRTSSGVIRLHSGITVNVEGNGNLGSPGSQMRVGNNSPATLNVQDNATVIVGNNGQSRSLVIAEGTSTSGIVNLNGGSLNISNAGTGGLILGANQSDELNPATATLNLNGGVLTAPYIIGGAGSALTSTFNFNGGTLVVTNGTIPAGSTYMNGLDLALVKAGGAIIDTNNRDITIAQPLEHDAALDALPEPILDGGLTKSGEGSLTLTGTSTYNGPTLVEFGSLVVNGTLPDTSAVTVQGGTLGGSGSIVAPVTVEFAEGAIAPGDGVGTLTVGSASVTSFATLAIEVDGASADKLVATGDIDVTDAMLTVTELAGGFTQPSYIIAEGATVTGNIDPFSIPEGYSVEYTATQVILKKDVIAPSGYAAWSLDPANGLTEGVNDGENDDPDNDGVSNLLEYVLGGIPAGAGSSDPSILPVQTLTATDLELAFNRSTASLGDVSVHVETSTDLSIWTPGPVITDTGAVTVQIPRAGELNGKIFGRIKATK